jgi:hypothetical protein
MVAVAEPTGTAPSLKAVLLESKEMVILLAAIALAFLIHFGFGDFVQTESSTPKVRPAAAEVGVSARVRAGEFVRAGQRVARRRAEARKLAAEHAAAARTVIHKPSPAPSTGTVTTPRSSSPSVPTQHSAPSKQQSSPKRSSGGGGGQSFDDSG